MITEVKVNELPESVQEATLVRWHRKLGEKINRGDKLADLETDKVVLEITAPAEGVLARQYKREGEALKRGEAVAAIDSDASAAAAAPAPPAPSAPPPPSAPAPAPRPAPAPSAPPAAATPPPAAPRAPRATATAAETEEQVLPDGLSPAVRKLILDNRLNPAEIQGTGPGGRITKTDVIRLLEHSPQVVRKFGEAAPEVEITKAPAAQPAGGAAAELHLGKPEQRVRMTRLRARIAERLLEAQRSAAILTTFNEVNMGPIMALRAKYKDAFEKQHGVKLGFMGFFVKACIESLKRFPVVNASVDGQDIVYHGYFDMGIAVSTSRGLVVPVLRNAERMSLAEIEKTIVDCGKRAEEGRLGMEELTGGTFTISNGGVFGSMLSTPILNPPQSAILGMHRIQNRPVAEGDQVVVRPMMYLALSYDHRIIDGREAVQFLTTVRDMLEDPTRFILQV